MATLSANNPTLLDLVKAKDPNGAIALVVEALSKRNPILQDMVWKEGNLDTGHQFTSRNSLPSPTWRKLNQGVSPNKSTREQTVETCGRMEAHSEIDEALVDLNGGAAYRASEDVAFLQAFKQELATGNRPSYDAL